MTIQGLKTLVIGMGLLILAGVAVIAVTVANRLAATGRAHEPVALRLPADATVVETDLDGDRLALRLDTAAGPRVIVVDVATGEVLRTVEVTR